MGYHVSDANSYIVITGGGVTDVKIVKKAWVWAWQKHAKISISPFDFEITLQAMTIEKLQFSLPAVFTIGPDDKPEALSKYAMLLTGNSDGTSAASKHKPTATGRNHVQDIVKGIIEGETRVIVSGMTMEEIFKERQVFKTKVIQNVQSELDQFGLKIYNANVKELQDTQGSEYFKFLSRKAHEGASNQAKVDVANARMIGEIGEAEKRGKTRQEISKIDAQTAVLETQRKSEKAQADAELTTTQTRLNMGINLAQIQATRQAEAKDAELQKDVETKRADMELERRRATDLVHAKIEKESAQQKADAKFYADTKGADGTLYKQRQDAEAAYFRATKEAEAAFYAKRKEAEGITEMAKAYGHMANVLGGPQGLMQYMMLQNGTYEKLAKANASAIQGLQPKITVWNTGEGASTSDSGAPIRNLFQSLPPLLSTINDQTGIAPPSWLAQLPNQAMNAAPKTNGTSTKGLDWGEVQGAH
ncbi:Flotillin family [Lasallia pustulata]|uniref:Flotillin family n=1 Tax=Lasallia pustulata TaxID=136370 RepID=A0A1W5DD95_9LECA|nr:Flotillin family [Lasallia pustulata]